METFMGKFSGIKRRKIVQSMYLFLSEHKLF
jgi:hypothetical protein